MWKKPKGPQPITVRMLNAHTARLMVAGMPDAPVMLDRRSLEHLLEKHLDGSGLCLPPEGDQIGGGCVFLRLAF